MNWSDIKEKTTCKLFCIYVYICNACMSQVLGPFLLCAVYKEKGKSRNSCEERGWECVYSILGK